MNGGVGGDALLVARGVSVRHGSRAIVEAVGLSLRRGEVVALLGPNGAGKSTLLAALAGLRPLSAGEVERGGRVAYAAQAPAMAARSARANVELGLAWWGVPRGERRAPALSALERLGAAAVAERHAPALSGGEQRRVHLARALAVRPDALLLDEPFAGLDPGARTELLYDVAGALRDPGRATLIVVHDRAEAWALADRVLVMLDGGVAAEGDPEQVLDRPPSPEVARFLGFANELVEGGELVMTRPGQALLDPAGPLRGRVVRKLPVEDGVRVELELAGGGLVALAPGPGPEAGEEVGVRLAGGVRFPLSRRSSSSSAPAGGSPAR